jgi:hypothetical protein
MSQRDPDQRQEIYQQFNDAVNMTPKELEQWLDTDESKEAGWHGDDDDKDESVGHASGRRIIEIKHTKKDDLSEDDYDHMKKVVGYVNRHTKQRPDKPDDELEEMTWTHSLKNWGHDPLK